MGSSRRWTRWASLLEEKASNCTVLQIPNPILTSVELMKIRYMDRPGFHVETVSLLYYKGSPLENALDQLLVKVDRTYKKGTNILILSDRGVDEIFTMPWRTALL